MSCLLQYIVKLNGHMNILNRNSYGDSFYHQSLQVVHVQQDVFNNII